MALANKLKVDSLALRSLPLDRVEGNFTRQVPGACFSMVDPTPVENPELVAFSASALKLLGIDEDDTKLSEFVQLFAGNEKFSGSQTAAHCYCGHQFGSFAGQLGDGAAIYLGEVMNTQGERWELQLKGAGKTPYSRTADGRKVLRSSIREFLCSEAMHALGIPTTRAGTCITSDSRVIRDIFYNGNANMERCTVVSRIAPTFIRFGSFEICKPEDELTGRQGPSVGKQEVIETLLNYTVATFFPEIWTVHSENNMAAYAAFYEEVVLRTARLVAQWMCVGWCHGVLNTDNMSIVGLTIDYGPFGFLDAYDPRFICNHSDDGGRYAYDQQPGVCRWNLEKLADALEPFVERHLMNESLKKYNAEYQKTYDSIMRKKFGLISDNISDEELGEICRSFHDTLEKTGADFTNTFRALNRLEAANDCSESSSAAAFLDYVLTQCASVDDLRRASAPKMADRQFHMLLVILQNQPELLAQLRGGQRGLEAELKRREQTQALQNLTEESKKETDRKRWEEWVGRFTAVLDKQDSSVDPAERQEFAANRIQVMNQHNPRYILRNYLAEQVIRTAEAGDYGPVRRLLARLEKPFDEGTDIDEKYCTQESDDVDEKYCTQDSDVDDVTSASCSSGHVTCLPAYDAKPPSWAADLRVT